MVKHISIKPDASNIGQKKPCAGLGRGYPRNPSVTKSLNRSNTDRLPPPPGNPNVSKRRTRHYEGTQANKHVEFIRQHEEIFHELGGQDPRRGRFALRGYGSDQLLYRLALAGGEWMPIMTIDKALSRGSQFDKEFKRELRYQVKALNDFALGDLAILERTLN